MRIRTMIRARLAWAIVVAAPLILAVGCVPPSAAEQEAVKKDMNYLLAVEQGLRKKVAELEQSNRAMAADVEQMRRGLASLTIETKSALAEANADLDKFLEDFSHVRGGAEENEFLRRQFSTDIALLKQQQALIGQRLEELRVASARAADAGERGSGEMRTAIDAVAAHSEALAKRVDELAEKAAAFERKDAALATHVADLETLVLKSTAGAAPPAPQAPTLDPQALYMEGYRQVVSKDFAGGGDTLKRFLELYPAHELADNAQYWLGEVYYGIADWEGAVLEFSKVVKVYPDGDKVPSAMLKLGYAFQKLGADKEARVVLEGLIEKHPKSPEAANAKAKLKELGK